MYDDLPIFRAGNYYVRVLADSISPLGVRLVTIECCYPRWLHPEVLRTRADSHSVESSRAVPPDDKFDDKGRRIYRGTISRVLEEPFVPMTFNERVVGMGVGKEFDELRARDAREAWLGGAQAAAETATALNEIGLDKSRTNRVLEPYLWLKDIITATEWKNMLALRCPPGDEVDLDFPAQPEFQQFALLVRQALRSSQPRRLENGWWHLPGATSRELHQLCDMRENPKSYLFPAEEYVDHLKQVCPRRLAKISFDKASVPEDSTISIAKYGELVDGAHWSPLEHVATPLTGYHCSQYADKVLIPADQVNLAVTSGDVDQIDLSKCWAGNFRGWFQHRKEYATEHDRTLFESRPDLDFLAA